MEKEFVPYELAVKLKALGFDEPCLGYYYNKELSFGARTSYGEVIESPTFSQAFRWFREKYGYWSYVKESTKGMCRFYIEKFENHSFISAPYRVDEEAERACLDKLIEIAESKSE